MTKVTNPVVTKFSKIKDRFWKNPIIRGLRDMLIGLLNISREFYIANDTLHHDRPSRKQHPMGHI